MKFIRWIEFCNEPMFEWIQQIRGVMFLFVRKLEYIPKINRIKKTKNLNIFVLQSKTLKDH